MVGRTKAGIEWIPTSLIYRSWNLFFTKLIFQSQIAKLMSNLTFGIIKPDVVKKRTHGTIIQRILDNDFNIRAMKLIYQTKEQAEGFYAVHAGKPFYKELTEFMSSGPCVALVLEKEDAVSEWRKLMGATNPAEANEGTLRKEFASSIGENAVHGSDSDENAAIEIAYFFSKIELVPDSGM